MVAGDLTFTYSMEYQGERSATAATINHLGGKQLKIANNITFDIGTRQLFHIGETNIAIRLLMRNIFDEKAWHAPSPDILFPKHRRSVLAVASVDF